MKRSFFPILRYLWYTPFPMPSRITRTGRMSYPLKQWGV